VRLASQFDRWDIDILTGGGGIGAAARRNSSSAPIVSCALDVDETRRAIAASEGFRSSRNWLFVEPTELATIEGFDADTAARDSGARAGQSGAFEAEFRRAPQGAGGRRRSQVVEGVTTPMLVKLGENGR